jgi:hypothetical protein
LPHRLHLALVLFRKLFDVIGRPLAHLVALPVQLLDIAAEAYVSAG